MRRALIALLLGVFAAGAAEAATCTAVTGTWGTGISAGTALSGSPDPDCQAPFTINDTLQIPSGVTVTIAAGATVNFSTGSGTVNVDAGGTLVVNGTLKLYNDVTNAGTIYATGTARYCVTGSGQSTCTVAGQSSIPAYSTNTWNDYTVSSGTYFQMTNTGAEWNATPAAATDVVAFTDLDGNPLNDAPGAQLRMFFNVQAAASGYVRTTYAVGTSGVSDSTYIAEALTTYGAGSCAPADLDLDGTPDSNRADDTDGAADGTNLDDTLEAANFERATTISLPAGTLVRNGDFVGQYISANIVGANVPMYLIWKSTEGGAGRDSVRIWPPLRPVDWTSSARQCFITWGEGQGRFPGGAISADTENQGLGANEFVVFAPAKIMGNRAAVEINTTGHFIPTFAVLGAQDTEAGFAPQVYYQPTPASGVTYDDTWRYTWSVGQSRNRAGKSCDGIAVRIGGPSSTNLTFDHVRITHNFEALYGTACDSPTDADYTSGSHGFMFDSNGSATFRDSGCFNIGDACLFDQIADNAVSGTGSRLTLRRFMSGWIQGRSSGNIKPQTRSNLTVDADGVYVVRPIVHQAQCGNGATLNQGAACTADAGCGGGVGSCVETAQATINNSYLGAPWKNVVLIGKVDEGAQFAQPSGQSAGVLAGGIDGGFILDARTNNTNAPNAATPYMFGKGESFEHISAPYGVQPTSSSTAEVVRSLSNNWFGRVEESWGSGQEVLIRCKDDAGAVLSGPCRVENNYIQSLKDNGIPFVQYASSPPNGARLYVNNNYVDREVLADADYFVYVAGADFDDPAYGEQLQVKNNVLSGYRNVVECAAAYNNSSEAIGGGFGQNPVASGNIFSLSTAAPLAFGIQSNCVPSTYQAPLDALNFSVNRLFAMRSNRLGIGRHGIAGIRTTAGYPQNAWLDSLGIDSVWVPGSGATTAGPNLAGGGPNQ